MLDLAVGARVGSYRIEGLLGAGGSSSVYRATHAVLDRPAALKVMHAHLADSVDARERMLREARILESLHHPMIAEVYDVGVLADGRAWVAMELVDGETLTELLARRGALPIAEAARILIGIARPLATAHALGVIHRDIKPDNVLVAAAAGEVRVKLVDWGIARAPERVRLTADDASPGTPRYMSPEQAGGDPVDARADVYALGVVAYELLAGQPPFTEGTALELALQHLTARPRPLRELRPDVPGDIAELVHAMLAKAPMERPALAVACGYLAAVCGGDDDAYASFEVTLDGGAGAEAATALISAPSRKAMLVSQIQVSKMMPPPSAP